MAEASYEPIRFQGPPARLTAHLQMLRSPDATPAIEVGDGRYPLIPAGDERSVSSLSFVMPANTPPGELDATVILGGNSFPAVIDVRPRSRVLIKPRLLKLRARAGEDVTAQITLKNVGNATVSLSLEESLVLRPSGALARGIRSAFKKNQGDLAAKMIALGEHITEEPSLALRVTAKIDRPTLDIDATRRMRLKFSVPEELPAGDAWTGVLTIAESRVDIVMKTIARGDG